MADRQSVEVTLGAKPSFSIDPFEIRIQEEVEEFLRDLTLEFPFPAIFETLRRCEFRDRFSGKILPFPKLNAIRASDQIGDIDNRIRIFLAQLRSEFGKNYHLAIEDSFRFYTQTTID